MGAIHADTSTRSSGADKPELPTSLPATNVPRPQEVSSQAEASDYSDDVAVVKASLLSPREEPRDLPGSPAPAGRSRENLSQEEVIADELRSHSDEGIKFNEGQMTNGEEQLYSNCAKSPPTVQNEPAFSFPSSNSSGLALSVTLDAEGSASSPWYAPIVTEVEAPAPESEALVIQSSAAVAENSTPAVHSATVNVCDVTPTSSPVQSAKDGTSGQQSTSTAMKMTSDLEQGNASGDSEAQGGSSVMMVFDVSPSSSAVKRKPRLSSEGVFRRSVSTKATSNGMFCHGSGSFYLCALTPLLLPCP